MNKKYKKLIISGGGINGIAIVGTIYEFSKKFNLDNLEEIIGVSIGSIIGLLIVIGYNADEICNIFY